MSLAHALACQVPFMDKSGDVGMWTPMLRCLIGSSLQRLRDCLVSVCATLPSVAHGHRYTH
jgi:hypothetical protein